MLDALAALGLLLVASLVVGLLAMTRGTGHSPGLSRLLGGATLLVVGGVATITNALSIAGCIIVSAGWALGALLMIRDARPTEHFLATANR